MLTPSIEIDPSKEALFTSGNSHYEPDLDLYESVWAPKIKAYNEALNKAIPQEFLAPKELIPLDLDTAPFNATLIPPKVLDSETLEITGLTAVVLARKIATKELTSVQVIRAFIKRATIAHQLTNCALEILFDYGYKRAVELDEYLAKHGKTVGPFHGVPISLKGNSGFVGRVSHGGFVSCLDFITPTFSVTNQTLYDLGAVFYIRTTEPQSLMHLDSINNITGRARNPYKLSMSPGGSSSGEGALIGMRGSPLGIRSDIGGSVRAPAAFNGIYGFKPSSRRVSSQKSFKTAEETTCELIIATPGPMANSLEDIEFFMKNYIQSKPWGKDQSLAPIPWREVATPTPSSLTIAIVYDDGVVKPHPPIIRALKEVEIKLKANGVNVIVWDPYKVYQANQIAVAGFTADGNYASKKRFEKSGEPLLPLTEHFLNLGNGDKGLTSAEFEFYTNLRDVLRAEYHSLFSDRGVDFILSPTYVGVASKPSSVKYWGYTLLWNLLDLPSCTIPTGIFANKRKDPKDEEYKPRNDYEEYEYSLYDAEASDGLPVGFTIIGRRYNEEATLKATQVVDQILKI